MKRVPYTYCLVKYVHNPSIGEMLNIGVLMCAPERGFIGSRFNNHYERLSHAFSNFDGDHYRSIIKGVETAIDNILELTSSPALFLIHDFPENAEKLARIVAPDSTLSIQFGGMLAGITFDLEDELEHIFHEAVVSQYPQKDQRRRDDEQVWAKYRRELRQKHIDRYLRPKRFVTENYDYKFDYAFKNERWHVLKPVAMDYAQSQSLQEKATKLLGEGLAIADNPELGTLYLLLGEPREESHKGAYEKAKNLLNKIPVKKQIIEENEADDFADYLADYMEKHGVFDVGNQEDES